MLLPVNAAPVWGGLWVLFGCVMVVLSMSRIVRATRATRWPTVRGRIDRVRMNMGELPSRNGKQQYFKPVVQYRYTVGNQEYTGSRLRFGGAAVAWDISSAWSQTALYSPDQEVTVHVSPTDPTISVLETGVGGQMFLVIALGIASVAWGIYLLLPYV